MDEEIAVTRSVEIPEDAVEAAQKAWTKAYWTEATPAKNDWMRAALDAALPYLAPAGDGGLREALAAQLYGEVWSGKPWDEATPQEKALCYKSARRFEQIITEHSAAPAVPQPAEVEYEDEELETEADVERRNHWFRLAVELGQQDEFIEMLTHERRMPATRADLDAAVPQPVDREALRRLAEKWVGMDTPALSAPGNREWATGVDQGYSNAAAELLAALAGEQEQVESPE